MTALAQSRIFVEFIRQSPLYQSRILSPIELERYQSRSIVAGIQGEITIEGKKVWLCIGVDQRFPLSLPIIFLCQSNALGLIPHVEQDGYICYLDSEGILLDFDNPVGLLLESTELAINVLKTGVSGNNHSDFMDEFGVYWERLCSVRLAAWMTVDDVLRRVFVYRNSRGYELVADQLSTVHAYLNHQNRALDSLTRRAVLYVPLAQNAFILPPKSHQMWNERAIHMLIRQNLSFEQRQQLQRLGKNWKSEELSILGLPRPNGGRTLIGLLFSGVTNGHPLLSGRFRDCVPIHIQRYDSAYLVPRGGGQLSLNTIRVLVIGCGSVGGYIPFALAQAGIVQLTLVDPDIMRLENTFRHVLGRSAIGKPKVSALKEEFESKYPYMAIKIFQQRIEDAIVSRDVDLLAFDLAILAIGQPTIELHVNRLLHKDGTGPLTVFTWVEPYSIGGHALLTRPGKQGCFQCLFTSNCETDTPLHNRAAFAAYGQSFGKDDLGCGSLYTPYGALDAEKTAESAVRLALDGLMQREQGNPILSWKGPDDNFIAAGFQLSSRYQLTSDQLHEQRYNYINAQCPACGGLSR